MQQGARVLTLVLHTSEGLEALHAAGGRRFMVWQFVAGESVPLVNTINGLLNQVRHLRLPRKAAIIPPMKPFY